MEFVLTQPPPSAPTTSTSTQPPLIATLESYLSPTLSTTSQTPAEPSAHALSILTVATQTKLRNVAHSRIRDMRSLGHAKQVISHIPIVTTPQVCTKINDGLQSSIRLNADRFVALALLPCGRGDGKEAAKELVRCVSLLKFGGGMIGVGKECGWEDGSWEELWTAAEKYRVPIAVRVLWPMENELEGFNGQLTTSTMAPMATHLHAIQDHSTLPLIRLYLGGVFDRHPNLRLILAHPGALPSLLPRIDTMLAEIPESDKPKRSFLDVWQHNIYLTTADVLDMSALRTLLEQIPVDRVLYASNYPLETRGKELMDELETSGFLSRQEWESVAWGNAEYLFRLKPDFGKRGGRL